VEDDENWEPLVPYASSSSSSPSADSSFGHMAEYDADWDIESLDFLNLENMFLLPDDPMNIEEISSLSSDDYPRY
jgi:hypothetical protein